MSKRPKHNSRKKRKKKTGLLLRNKLDVHHLCYQGRNWKRGALRLLREHPYCKVIVPKDTLHREIHLFVWDIPAPKEENAREALRQLNLLQEYGAISDKDPLEKRLLLLTALFESIEQPTANAFKMQRKIVHEFYNGPQ